MMIIFRMFFLKNVFKSRFLLECRAPLIMTKTGTAHLETDSKMLVINQLRDSGDKVTKCTAVQCIMITKKIATVLNKSK